MRFYNRNSELQFLSEVRNRSKENPQMTIIVGRRRIGKTRLLIKAYGKDRYLYFFVSRKSEKLLCEEYIEEAKNKIGIKTFGEIGLFKDIFGLLLETSKTKAFTLIIDEFQEFQSINPSVYSEMQNLWDKNKTQSKINLILCGSIYSLMKKIFEHAKEPLFGRVTERIQLKPFNIITIKKVLRDGLPDYTKKDLLAFYIFTGGVAKYVEWFADKKALRFDDMLDEIFYANSYFLDEGKNLLIEEFGKEYSTYFSILELIANSKTSRSEIESILEKNVGGYIDNLENEYNIIEKIAPVFARKGSRNMKYLIKDNFLNFWFRFIYKYRSTVEIGNFDYMKTIFKRDFDTYSGKLLEKYFIEKLAQSNAYSLIGRYWMRGNRNEIDIVALNQLSKEALIAEVKINKKKINLRQLKEKAKSLSAELQGFKIHFKGFSLENM